MGTTFGLLALLLVMLGHGSAWQAHFKPAQLKLNMETTDDVLLTLAGLDPEIVKHTNRYSFRLESDAADLASVATENAIIPVDHMESNGWNGNISIVAYFLGEAHITVRLYDEQLNVSTKPDNVGIKDSSLLVQVVRPHRPIDTIFVITIITLMSLVYINFGAALNLEVLRGLVTRPVGPCICFITQVVGMPLLSYALGIFIFPESPAMQLGLFFTGIAPSGGASNTWSAVLGANINLSVLMTTVSNVAVFATMPVWIFTLGQLIFERAGMEVPYGKLASYCVSLIVPLLIGLAIQRWLPRVAQIMVRWLKPISAGMIGAIIILAVATNFYLFKLFTWQVSTDLSHSLVIFEITLISLAGCPRWSGTAWTGLCLRLASSKAVESKPCRRTNHRHRDGHTEHWYCYLFPDHHIASAASGSHHCGTSCGGCDDSAAAPWYLFLSTHLRYQSG